MVNTAAPETQAHHSEPGESEYVLHRRFDRMARLVGDANMQKLMRTHVMVIGLGGVGSFAAESLARSGIGELTLVDFDEICITNTNRQLHALQGLVGRKKAEVMAERCRKINPQARVNALPLFYNSENSETILSFKPDFIVDAIDNLTAKCHLIATLKQRGMRFITCAGSAAKMDPLAIRVSDLGATKVDPMASQVRKILRQKYEFPEGREFGVPCVYSEEEPIWPHDLKYDKGQGFKCVCPQGQNNLHSCDNRNLIHGSASFVTGAFGLAAAAWVVSQVTGPISRGPRS
ncbi:MAG: tRNA threonylcarbamoyladenosine dehydratase [Bdellovibrionaceae bacterium]|nr:tRNA threonylcarbamoyladenosine dehydratase [Pseudobdellovibrionaceae bacterium]